MSKSESIITDLKAPKISPKINMNDPNFDKLTSAEKLNDSEYRRGIYRNYPNEPTCNCSSIKKTNNSSNCPGYCIGKCCNSKKHKNLKIQKNDYNCCGKRMRGGGCEDIYRKRDEQFQCPIINKKNENYNNYYYASRSERLNSNNQNENPCLGIDCLIRAFKETQEFVDSLGKVPGLAGLGLPDPQESPYFRTKEHHEEIEKSSPEISKTRKKHFQEKIPSKIIETKPFPLPSSGRRETFRKIELFDSYLPIDNRKSGVSLNEQIGPCGQVGCKSIRKKEIALNSSENGKLTKEKKNSKKKSKNHRQSRNKVKSKSRADDNEIPLRKKIRWVYLAGDTYPGIVIGHKNCNDQRRRVPANMGWLWNTNKTIGRLKPRVGWRPGALSRTLKEIIKEIKAGALEDSRSRSPSRGARSVKTRSQTSLKKIQSKKLDEDDDVEPPPTLHVLRKDGTYYVTMYPIKQETMEIPKLEEPMKPLQFKIVKDKDNVSEISDSTVSDIEIEFSPPAAVNRYRKKPDVVHVDTQVKQQEIFDAFKPEIPKKEKKGGKKGKK